MNVVMFVQMGTQLRGSFALLLLAEMMMIITYQLLGVLLISATSNLRLGLSLGSGYAMMALTFSGLSFPAFAMPLAAQIVSLLFPFTYWIKIFISQAMRGEDAVRAVVPMAAFIVFILLSVSFLPRLKRVLKDERYWGKI